MENQREPSFHKVSSGSSAAAPSSPASDASPSGPSRPGSKPGAGRALLAESTGPSLSSTQFRSRFRALILLTWTIPPVFGLSFLMIIGMFTTVQMGQILIRPIEPLFVLASLVVAAGFLMHFVRPVVQLLEEGHRAEWIALALTRLSWFPFAFWALFLGYLLLAPSSVMISAELYTDFVAQPLDWFRIHLVALIVSIIVGLPIFFLLMDLFGRAMSGIAFPRAQVTIKTKVFLIGTLIPLLIDTMLVQYYWTRTGFFSAETFVIWLMLELLAIGGTLIFVRSFGQALRPLQSVMREGRGRPTFESLRAQSTDELGLLTNQFRALLGDIEFHSRVRDISNRILRTAQPSSTMDEVLQVILGLCHSEVGGDTCLLALLDKTGEDLVCVVVSGGDYRPEGHFRLARREPSLAWQALERGEVVAAVDTSETPCSVRVMEQLGPRSAIVAPMRTPDGDLGVLMSLDRRETRRYRERDREVIGVLADEAALALHTLMLRERRREAEERIRHLDELARVSLEAITDGVIVTDVNGCVQHINPVAAAITGWSASEAVGQPVQNILRLIDPASGRGGPDLVGQTMASGKAVKLEDDDWTLQRPKGGFSYVSLTSAPVRHPDKGVVGAVLGVRDVTQLRSMARSLSYQATHDHLTGLINRREFEARLQQALDTARNASDHHVLIYIDLDQFKVVNDTCGHRAGDALLAQLAGQLQSRVRRADTLGRLGGDEFGVLLWGCSVERARTIAAEFQQAVEDFRFTWEDKVFKIGASMGLVPVDAASGRTGDLLSAADAACYAAKEAGGHRVREYQGDDASLAERRGELYWVQRVQKALDEGALRLFFQPIVPLHDGARPRAFGEILLRMVDESGGIILPAAFLGAAERYRIVAALDRWVVTTALDALTTTADKADELAVFTVNLSGQSLSDETFLSFLASRLESDPVARSKLCFEITETAAIANVARARKLLSTVRGFGCRLALDDFGSGLSSFSYLQNLPVDYLKIDGCFVVGMAASPMQRAIVEAINHVGHVMGIQTIAEWVENEATLNALRTVGVDFAQGFATGAPVPLSDVLTPQAGRT